MGIGFLSFCEQLEVFREHGLSVPLGTYVGVELVGDMALCLTFWGTTKVFQNSCTIFWPYLNVIYVIRFSNVKVIGFELCFNRKLRQKLDSEDKKFGNKEQQWGRSSN